MIHRPSDKLIRMLMQRKAPNLNLGRFVEVPVRAKVGLAGFATVELIDAATGVVKRRLEFPNLIVDAGLNSLGDGTAQIANYLGGGGYCAVGTGSTAPANTDVGLEAELVRTTADGGFGVQSGSGAGFAYHYLRSNFFFDKAEANGNLTEFGIFMNNTGAPMLARQLFKDGTGTPTTITKTTDDQLRIIYEFRVYPNTTVNSQSITIDGNATTVDSRAYDIDDPDRWGPSLNDAGMMAYFGNWGRTGTQMWENNAMPATTDPQTGAKEDAENTAVVQAYTAGNFYRDLVITIPAAKGNGFATGIGSIEWFGELSRPECQITTFNPKIVKTDVDELVITARLAWARATI